VLDFMWGEVLAPGDEDCLTLNVWTPASDDQRRPVMVYIHGGAFIIGSGRWGWYEGCRLVERGDVVLVTINYRLGAFGFLDLSEVGGKEFAASGNCGLLDQIAALRWVRENIHHFGGDPENVTVFGESAGGISIGCLLGCPQAHGLFHRAICMSGHPSMVRPKGFARRVTKQFMRLARVTSVGELLALPMQRMLAAQKQLVRSADFLGEMFFGPVVDGETLTEPPLHAIRAGKAAGVTLLTGTTLDELRLWSLYNRGLPWVPPRALTQWLRTLGLVLADLCRAYHQSRPDLRGGNLTMAMVGDALFWMPQIRLAEAQSLHRPDTRMYLVAWRTPVRGGRLGAPHAVELPFVFGNLDAAGVHYMTGCGPDLAALSDAMQGAWLAFAKTGNPGHGGIPEWPAYETDRRATMVFDNSCALVQDPLTPVRCAWERLAFDGVRPAIAELPRVTDIIWFIVLRCLVALGLLALTILLVVLLVLALT
jgi:para-nitrobenzyl esterase